MAPNAGPAPAPKPPLVPHVLVRNDIPPAAADAPPPPVRVYKNRRGLIVKAGAAAAVLVVAGGFAAWKFFSAPDPVPVKKAPAGAPAKAAVPAKTGGPTLTPAPAPAPESRVAEPAKPTPSATMNAIAAAPAQTINRAERAANTQEGRTAGANEVLDADQPAAAAPALRPAPAPAAPTLPSPTTRMAELAPGVSAAVPSEASVEASAAFRTLVGNLRVSGVAGGASPKALINGRLIHVGDIVDAGLGVSFAGVNGNQLVFKDRSGATVLRKY